MVENSQAFAEEFEQRRRAFMSELVQKIVDEPEIRTQLVEDTRGTLAKYDMCETFDWLNEQSTIVLRDNEVAGYEPPTAPSRCCYVSGVIIY